MVLCVGLRIVSLVPLAALGLSSATLTWLINALYGLRCTKLAVFGQSRTSRTRKVASFGDNDVKSEVRHDSM